MNFRQMKYVITVAEEKNFSKAANKLYIAQPSLSQYIQNLEKQLGVQLFDRTSIPIQLTRAGELYVGTAKRILAMGDELAQQIADLSNLKKGSLIIGCSAYRYKYLLPNVIRSFNKNYPGIDVIAVEKGILDLEKLLLNGEIDMFLTTPPFREHDFDVASIYTERILLALPPNYPLDKNLPRDQTYPYLQMVPISMFRDMPFVLLEPNQPLRDNAEIICKKAGFKPRIVLTCRSFDSAIAMVKANIGITFIPDTIVKFGDLGQLVTCCVINEIFPTRDILIAYRKGGHLSKAAFEFISLANEILNSEEQNYKK